jgi:hypothetical protein
MLVIMPLETVTTLGGMSAVVNVPDTPTFSNAIVPRPDTAIVIDPAPTVIVMFAPGGLSGAYYRLRLRALTKKSS